MIAQDTPQNASLLTVERALDILDAFTVRTPKLGLAELSRLVKVPKPSMFRYLAVLERRGFIQRGVDGKYSLGAKLLGMGTLVRAHLRIVDIALPFMDELRAKHGETVNLAMLERGEIVHIEVLEGLYAIKMTSPVGSRAAAHSTGLGKAILAFAPPRVVEEVVAHRGLSALTPRTLTSRAALLADLEVTRGRGFALDDGESEDGLCCVGAPLFDSAGEVPAAISVSGLSTRMQEAIDEIARNVTAAAADISSRLGAGAPSPGGDGRRGGAR